ncbi:MAG: tight adherence protein C [Nitriliruptoraceae bacterium]|jgi:tight adherence protein C
MRLLLASGVAAWVGLTLLLAELRWFSRASLIERLAPYVPGAWGTRRAGLLSVESFREAVAPLARSIGERLSSVLGITESLERRLARVHAQLDPTGFRVRQLGWALGAFGVGVLFAAAVRPPPAMGVLLMFGAPALAFLLLEQQVVDASSRWKRQLYLELPVVAEQIGMLLGAGWSLFGALDRVAVRGEGAVAADLGRVVSRIRQGRSEADALREWGQLADVPAVDRLVSVLSLDRETTDLAGLIAAEARSIRKDVHRELLETMGKRSQKVWIPVTVATLLPGVIFIAIPFIKAVELFAG